MKWIAQYKRENPDTILGEKIIITQIYSSFDKEEIDKVEQYCKDYIGDGIVTDLKGEQE